MRARWHQLLLMMTLFLFIGCDSGSVVSISESIAQAESNDESVDTAVFRAALCSSGTKDERLSCLLDQYHSLSDAYGSLIYIVDAQGNAYEAATGSTQKGEEILPTIDDAFRTGEISELFTTIALTHYANTRDDFSLDDYAATHLPESFKTDTNLSNIQSILISTFLKHRSGYADYDNSLEDSYLSNSTLSYTLDTILDSTYTTTEDYDYVASGTTIALRESTLFYPGNGFFHSPLNYYLAGEILEEINGTDTLDAIFSDTLKELNTSMHQYTALQLNNTYYPSETSIDDSHFNGYTRHEDTLYDITDSDPSFFGASGAIITTARDMMNLIRFINSAQFQSTSFFDTGLMQFDSTDDTDVGYGYGIKEIEGRYIGQDGLVPGFRSFAYYDSQSALNIVIVSNYTEGFSEGIDGMALIKEVVGIFE